MPNIPEFYFSHITEIVSGHPVLIVSDMSTAHCMPPCILVAAQSLSLIFLSIKMGVIFHYFFTARVSIRISVPKRK